ncbi:MAG: ASCH domain-containing protein [Candidatus Kariarchaeaceae archaeon]|jgi:uncharacterized protein YhfF
MIETEKVLQFWKDYCNQVGIDYTKESPDDAWAFGDNPKLANELAQLVIEHKKTTTAASMLEHKHYNWNMAKQGDLVVVLDGEDVPKAVIEFVEVKIMKFKEMNDVQFAIDEGEGFNTLEIWRDIHWRYFSRTLDKFGKKASEDMEIVCMRFKCVYPQ